MSFTTKTLLSEDDLTWSELGSRVYLGISKQEEAGYS